MVGSGIGGLETIQNQVIRMHDKGPERVAPLFIPMAIGNMVAEILLYVLVPKEFVLQQ